MRKLCLFVLLALLLTACGKADPAVTNSNAPLETETPGSTVAQSPADSAVPQNQGDAMDSRYLYRGFSTISLDDMAAFEAFSGFGTKLILNEEDWSTFMGSYCPGIPYYDTCDFSKECLIASVIQAPDLHMQTQTPSPDYRGVKTILCLNTIITQPITFTH